MADVRDLIDPAQHARLRALIGEVKPEDAVEAATETEVEIKSDGALEHKNGLGTTVLETDDKTGYVKAVVSVTGVQDRVSDIIEPGAYEASLQKQEPIGVWSHDDKTWVARAEDVKELLPGDPYFQTPEFKAALGKATWPREAGALVVGARFNLETPHGAAAYSDVKFFKGKTSWSIGYRVQQAKRDVRSGVRRIKSLDLYEFSPVMVGANQHAMTLSVKSMSGEHAVDPDEVPTLDVEMLSPDVTAEWEAKRAELLDAIGGEGAAAPEVKEYTGSGCMVALYPSDELAQSMAVDGGESPDDLHITLAYMATTPEGDDLERLKSVVAAAAAQQAPLEGVIGGSGTFNPSDGSDGKPVSVLLPDVPGLSSFREDLVAALNDAGFDVSDSHGYTPHITLAYDNVDASSDADLEFGEVVLVAGGEQYEFSLGGDDGDSDEDDPNGMKTASVIEQLEHKRLLLEFALAAGDFDLDLKRQPSHVRTAEGARKYGVPIGTLIGADGQPVAGVVDKAKAVAAAPVRAVARKKRMSSEAKAAEKEKYAGYVKEHRQHFPNVAPPSLEHFRTMQHEAPTNNLPEYKQGLPGKIKEFLAAHHGKLHHLKASQIEAMAAIIATEIALFIGQHLMAMNADGKTTGIGVTLGVSALTALARKAAPVDDPQVDPEAEFKDGLMSLIMAELHSLADSGAELDDDSYNQMANDVLSHVQPADAAPVTDAAAPMQKKDISTGSVAPQTVGGFGNGKSRIGGGFSGGSKPVGSVASNMDDNASHLGGETMDQCGECGSTTVMALMDGRTACGMCGTAKKEEKSADLDFEGDEMSPEALLEHEGVVGWLDEDEVEEKAIEHEPLGTPGGKQNWVDKAGQLPAYVQHIAKDLHEQRGMTLSHAIATAISMCKKWAAGAGGVKPDTRTKAAAAVAEWEALKAKSHVKEAVSVKSDPSTVELLQARLEIQREVQELDEMKTWSPAARAAALLSRRNHEHIGQRPAGVVAGHAASSAMSANLYGDSSKPKHVLSADELAKLKDAGHAAAEKDAAAGHDRGAVRVRPHEGTTYHETVHTDGVIHDLHRTREEAVAHAEGYNKARAAHSVMASKAFPYDDAGEPEALSLAEMLQARAGLEEKAFGGVAGHSLAPHSASSEPMRRGKPKSGTPHLDRILAARGHGVSTAPVHSTTGNSGAGLGIDSHEKGTPHIGRILGDRGKGVSTAPVHSSSATSEAGLGVDHHFDKAIVHAAGIAAAEKDNVAGKKFGPLTVHPNEGSKFHKTAHANGIVHNLHASKDEATAYANGYNKTL